MKITNILVENFCSIKQAEIQPSQFNVFIGQNNHGKTNLFEAISWFYSGKGSVQNFRFGRTGDAEVAVEISFSGVQDALQKMKNEKNRSSIQKVVGDRDALRARRSSNDIKIRQIFDDSAGVWLVKNPTGFDSAFNDFLPIFEYVDTRIRLEDVSKFGKNTAIGSMLSGVLTAILENSQKYKEFREKFDELFASPDSDVRAELNKVGSQVTIYIAKQFPDCTKVEFQITEPAFEELLKGCTTEVDDGIPTDASEKGDGMQRALMLAILQAYADFRRKGEAVGKNFLFFIDEAELHLHPTAQRSLKMALKDVSDSGDQVFVNTHSSVLVADEHTTQRIFRVEKINRETTISAIVPKDKPAIIYELLGGSPADLLLPRNFLIVEGRSDYEFLKQIIERFYPDKPPIQIVYSESDSEKQRRTMSAINTLFAPLFLNPVYKERLVIICDSPSTEKARKDLEQFVDCYPYLRKRNQLHVLSTASLEEYYVRSYRQTQDQVLEMKKLPFMKRNMAIHVGKNITLQEFEAEMPIVKSALDRCWELAHTLDQARSDIAPLPSHQGCF